MITEGSATKFMLFLLGYAFITGVEVAWPKRCFWCFLHTTMSSEDALVPS